MIQSSKPILPTPAAGEGLSSLSLAAIVTIGLVMAAASDRFAGWAKSLEEGHRRRQLLEAYRKRHAWKRGDISKLRKLDLSRIAMRRVERIQGVGRPVVKAPAPLVEVILKGLSSINALFNPEVGAADRRRAFKEWPAYPQFVEALYRGEHALAKERLDRNASVEGEICVGRAIGISSATVHALCGQVRAARKRDVGEAAFPAITVIQYDEWMRSGVDPWTEQPTSGQPSAPH
jgi:hypothetical protein